MTEMVTIQPDFNAPMRDDTIERARKWQAQNNKKQDGRRKVPFEQPRSCGKVFTGREEIGYENI